MKAFSRTEVMEKPPKRDVIGQIANNGPRIERPWVQIQVKARKMYKYFIFFWLIALAL